MAETEAARSNGAAAVRYSPQEPEAVPMLAPRGDVTIPAGDVALIEELLGHAIDLLADEHPQAVRAAVAIGEALARLPIAGLPGEVAR